MSTQMSIAACNAPVYSTGKHGFAFQEVITDHKILLTRATDEVLDQLTELVRSREDDENNVFAESLTSEQLEVFEYERDDDEGIVVKRRELALIVLKYVLGIVFELPKAGSTDVPMLNFSVTWITASIGDQYRTLLISGGPSQGHSPTEAAPAVYLLDLLNLFDKPFVRPGDEGSNETIAPIAPVEIEDGNPLTLALAWLAARGWTPTTSADHEAVEELVETLTDTDNFLDAFVSVDDIIDAFIAKNTPSALVPVTTQPLDADELIALNDQLTAQLEAGGWSGGAGQDFDALDNLTHAVAVQQAVINEMIEVFIAENSPVE